MSDIPRSAQPSGHSTPVTPDNVDAEKKSVRSVLRSRRKNRSTQSRQDAATVLTEQALKAVFLQNAHTVASFLPLPTEPDISSLNQRLAAQGIDVIVPVMLPDKDLTWRPLMTDDDLGKDAIARADVILTPALALGPHGERLGQGGGSYDRALPRRKSSALIVGVVFADELNQAFPSEKHDQCVHWSLTDRGLQKY